MQPSPIKDAELSAYVDGEVPPARRAAIEAFLADTPAAAALVAGFRRQNEALRAHFGAVAPPPTGILRPPPLTRTGTRTRAYRSLTAEPIRQSARVERMREEQRGRLALVTAGVFLAGAAAALIAATSLGFAPAVEDARVIPIRPAEVVFINDPIQAALSQALAAHRAFALDPSKPVEFEAAGTALTQNLSTRTGFHIEAPDLAGLGLKLLGGRIIPGESGIAGLLVYETMRGARFGLLVSPTGGLALDAPRFDEATISAALWTQANKAFALTGPGERETFNAIIAQIRGR